MMKKFTFKSEAHWMLGIHLLMIGIGLLTFTLLFILGYIS